jgi:hypothetical protein
MAGMSSIDEIEKAVQELPETALAAFRRWFYEFDARRWDAELESHAASGGLDEVAEQAISDFHAGRTRPL